MGLSLMPLGTLPVLHTMEEAAAKGQGKKQLQA